MRYNALNKNNDLSEVIDLLSKYMNKVCDEAVERHHISLFLKGNVLSFINGKKKDMIKSFN